MRLYTRLKARGVIALLSARQIGLAPLVAESSNPPLAECVRFSGDSISPAKTPPSSHYDWVVMHDRFMQCAAVKHRQVHCRASRSHGVPLQTVSGTRR